MNVAKRTKKLKALLDIRLGPGAAILPNDIKRLHLDFARKIDDGHFGARKVWRQYLPRLKYHNPAISMTVNRDHEQEGPSTLTVYFAPPPKSASPTTSPAPSSSTDPSTSLPEHQHFNRTESIDMKHKHESEILEKLMALTKGIPYEASPDELAELQDVGDYKRRSEEDRQGQAKLNAIIQQEKALLEKARGGGDDA